MSSHSVRDYDLRVADRIILIIVWVVVFCDAIINIFSNPGLPHRIFLLSLPGISIGAVFTGLYFLQINSLVRGFISGLFVFAGAIYLKSVFKIDITGHYLIFLSIALMAVYLRKELILAYGIFLNTAMVAIYIFWPELFFGTDRPFSQFLSVLMLLDGAFAGLYMLAGHGRKLISIAIRSEEEIQAIFNAVNDALFIHDAETGRILDVNERTCEMYGVTKDAMINSSADDFSIGISPYTQADANEWMRKAREKPQVFEWLAKRKDGKHLWVEVSMSKARIFDHVRIIVLVRDISQRKQTEKALRDSEEKWRTIVNTSPDGVAITAMDGTILEVSQKIVEICGYKESKEIIGRNYFELVDPSYHAKATHFVTEMFNGHYTGVAEYLILRKDGSKFFADINAEVLREETGVPKGVFFILRDITERKQTEEALRDSEAKFRSLIEQATEGFLLVDETGKIIEWNKAQEEIWGVKKEDVLGHPFWEIQYNATLPSRRSPERLDYYRRTLLEGVRTGHSPIFNKRLEAPISMKNGTTRWSVQTVFPIKMDKGFRLASISHDITDQKLVEEENARLQEQLRQSDKLRAIGELAGGVAHDFNNQLTGVMGYAELLRDCPVTPAEISQFAEKIILAVQRSTNLTSKLLAFARRGNYQSIPVNIHSIILEVIEILKHSIDKRIKIEQIFKADPYVFRGDPTQIQNAILNLALNSRDAMPNGGKLIFETSVVQLDNQFCQDGTREILPGKYLMISVQDTGTGMSPEVRDHIFEPFFTTKPKGTGTGLGLSAVYGTVKIHKGAIDVNSEPGRGAVFNIYFPLAAEEDSLKDESKTFEFSSQAPDGIHILLADDEPDVRDITSLMLITLGYDVVICANGREAAQIFEESPDKFDLVMLDMIMPEMSGQEVFKTIRALKPDVRILLATGYSANDAAQELLDQGRTSIIQKPFTKSKLSHAVATALGYPVGKLKGDSIDQ